MKLQLRNEDELTGQVINDAVWDYYQQLETYLQEFIAKQPGGGVKVNDLRFVYREVDPELRKKAIESFEFVLGVGDEDIPVEKAHLFWLKDLIEFNNSRL